MQNPFLHPGKGVALRNSASQSSTAIAATERTEAVGVGDCLEVIFYLEFAAPASGDVSVSRVAPDGTLEEINSVTLTADRTYQWSSDGPLMGQLVVTNDTDQTATVFCQKRIN
jgi:hypothetical protein